MTISLEEFSRAVAAVHEAAADAQQWPRALDAIMRAMQVQKGGLFDFTEDYQVTITARGHDPSSTAEYLQHYMALDPALDIAKQTPPHKACTCYELIAASERERSEYFHFARSADIGDVSATKTYGTEGHQTMLTLQRAYDARPFDAESKQLLQLLAPHLEIAKRVQIRLAEATAERDALSAGLDKFAYPAFILNAFAKIFHANTAALSLLSGNRTIRTAQGKLVFLEHQLNVRLSGALKSAVFEPRRSAALPWRLESEPAEITVSPLLPDAKVVDPWHEPLALMVIAIPRHDARWIAEKMQQLYSLTVAEARVAAQLALGETIESLSARSGVRTSTVRSQLKSIFGKTSVSRQSDLVRLALNGAPLNDDTPAHGR